MGRRKEPKPGKSGTPDKSLHNIYYQTLGPYQIVPYGRSATSENDLFGFTINRKY